LQNTKRAGQEGEEEARLTIEGAAELLAASSSTCDCRSPMIEDCDIMVLEFT
jgi:hypothetical protein